MRNNEDKLIGLIGLAKKAGKLRTGAFSVEQSIKAGKTRLCIVASDASSTVKKKYSDMCRYRDIPMAICGLDMETLGHAAGSGLRSAASVEDAGFAGRIMDQIEGGNANG